MLAVADESVTAGMLWERKKRVGEGGKLEFSQRECAKRIAIGVVGA